MKIFLDSAVFEDWIKYDPIISGAATNAKILNNGNVKDYNEFINQISKYDSYLSPKELKRDKNSENCECYNSYRKTVFIHVAPKSVPIDIFEKLILCLKEKNFKNISIVYKLAGLVESLPYFEKCKLYNCNTALTSTYDIHQVIMGSSLCCKFAFVLYHKNDNREKLLDDIKQVLTRGIEFIAASFRSTAEVESAAKMGITNFALPVSILDLLLSNEKTISEMKTYEELNITYNPS
jgi:transaldolase